MLATMSAYFDQRFEQYRKLRRENYDSAARGGYSTWSRYYHRRLEEVYRQNIPERSTILEVGCGKGDLLTALKPSMGVGIDLSPESQRRFDAPSPTPVHRWRRP
jgi:ubiquinone/menaquinone biosynthesis C-methylase UbiE